MKAKGDKSLGKTDQIDEYITEKEMRKLARIYFT